MRSIYQAIAACLLVIVCVAWSCSAYDLNEAEMVRREAEDVLDGLTNEEVYYLLSNVARDMSKRGSVKHLGLASLDNYRMMKNMNKLINRVRAGGKRSDLKDDE